MRVNIRHVTYRQHDFAYQNILNLRTNEISPVEEMGAQSADPYWAPRGVKCNKVLYSGKAYIIFVGTIVKVKRSFNRFRTRKVRSKVNQLAYIIQALQPISVTDNMSCLVVNFYLRLGTGKGAHKLHKNEFKNSRKVTTQLQNPLILEVQNHTPLCKLNRFCCYKL